MAMLHALSLSAALLIASAPALAQQTTADPHAHDDKGSASAQAETAPSSRMMGEMDQHMKKMQSLHDRMMSASTPEERQKVMDEARREMQEGMSMMASMMQGRGMGGGMMGQKGKLSDSNTRLQMMEKRMDIMQMMMQMMMDQQQGMASPMGSGAAPKK